MQGQKLVKFWKIENLKHLNFLLKFSDQQQYKGVIQIKFNHTVFS